LILDPGNGNLWEGFTSVAGTTLEMPPSATIAVYRISQSLFRVMFYYSTTTADHDSYHSPIITVPAVTLDYIADRFANVIIDATANAVIVTTPSATNMPEGTWIKFFRIDSVVANSVTIRRFGSGATFATLASINKWVKLRIFNGVWEIADNNVY
jgi:hypothetical protein